MGNVNANPTTVEPLGYRYGSAAAAKGIQHQVARIAADLENAFQQGFRLLRRIA